jgi:ADP-heptose:LPS heptosyltransferase
MPSLQTAGNCIQTWLLRSQEVRSIAMFRALKLGDMLCATPALRAVRARWPRAHITLVALPWFRELADRYTHLFDELIEFPGYPGLPEQVPDSEATESFLRGMRGRGFDLVVQMHGSGEVTNPLVRRFEGRLTTGFRPPDDHSPDYAAHPIWVEERPEPLRWLDLLDHLGIASRGTCLELPLGDRDLDDLERLRWRSGFAATPYVCVHPGASVSERRWPAAAFAALANRLSNRGYAVVLTGGPEERELTARVANLMHRPSIDLAGRTSLGQLATLVSQATLLVSNDTGLSHVAAATRTPSVIVSPVSDPVRWGPLDRYRHRVVDARQGATVEQVWAVVENLRRELAPSHLSPFTPGCKSHD